MRRETGCHGVMVDRAALGTPWVFAELAAAERGVPPPPPPEPAARIAAMRRHLTLYLEDYPEPVAVREIREHLVWHSRGLPRSVELRRRLQVTATAADVHAAIDAL